jgi:large subunit ribosomal protein L18
MASKWTRFPLAEKNLLKISLSNRFVNLQVVNNKTGHIFLWASTMEREMRERLANTWDTGAAKAVAGLLAQRMREVGQQQITYERGSQRYVGKVKAVVDTLRANGVEFVQHARKRAPQDPWD